MIDMLGQFYTEERFSKLLVDSLTTRNPKQVLELGTGKGALIKCVLDRWESTKITGIDIDKYNVNHVKNEFPSVKILMVDGLSRHLSKKINIEINSVDLAICNPPYINLKKNEFISEIIRKSLLGNPKDYKRITADLVFLANNLIYLKNGGELGIILPDGLITSHEFKVFRQSLIRNHSLKAVVELPIKSFIKTEAKTFILILRKGNLSKKNYPVRISKSNDKGEIVENLIINSNKLLDRMDFKFHSWSKLTNNLGLSLTELKVEIKRGKQSKKTLKNSCLPFIHTSEIIASKNNKIAAKIELSDFDGVYAEKGDLVMTRVGRSGLGKISRITEGKILISDCVYRIRGCEHVLNCIWEDFSSEIGQNWVKALSRGVCAKIISKTDLMAYRLSVFNENHSI
jgi:type I restriction enzyme M protein